MRTGLPLSATVLALGLAVLLTAILSGYALNSSQPTDGLAIAGGSPTAGCNVPGRDPIHIKEVVATPIEREYGRYYHIPPVANAQVGGPPITVEMPWGILTVDGVDLVDSNNNVGSFPAEGNTFVTPLPTVLPTVGRTLTAEELRALDEFLTVVAACTDPATRSQALGLFTDLGLRYLFEPGDPFGVSGTVFSWLLSDLTQPDPSFIPFWVIDARTLPTGHIAITVADQANARILPFGSRASLWLLAPTPDGLRIDFLMDATSHSYFWFNQSQRGTPFVAP